MYRNRTISAFAIGAIVGSVISYFATRKVLGDRFNEALLDMRKAEKKKAKAKTKEEVKEETVDTSADDNEERPKITRKITQPDTLEEFLKNKKRTHYDDIYKMTDEEDKTAEQKFSKIVFLSDEEFEDSDFDVIEYKYDGVDLYDMNGNVVDKTEICNSVDLEEYYDEDDYEPLYLQNKDLEVDYAINMISRKKKEEDYDGDNE